MPGDERSSRRRLIALGLSLEAGFLVLGHSAAPLPLRIVVQGILFILYLAALKEGCGRPMSRREEALLLGFAVAFRLSLVVQPPFYSDDLYRYLWDGHVQVAGHLNPYLYAPGDAALEPLRNVDFYRVNHPEIPTIYPPVAQLFFATVALGGGTATGLKVCLVFFDLALVFVLRSMLVRAGIGAERTLIYAWSPLVITEVAGNGHMDALALFFLVLGIHLIIMARPALSTILLGLAAGAKFLPLLAFTFLARKIPCRFWGIPFVVICLAYLPYLGAGTRLTAGLREYAERWQHNDGLFRVILGAFSALNPTLPLKSAIARLQDLIGDSAWIQLLYQYAYPVYLARFAGAVMLVGVAFTLTVRKVSPVKGTFFLVAAALLLSPTVHPWYLLWLAPFLVFFPNRAWILFTGLVPLSYLDPGPVVEGATPYGWIRWVEYLPFLALLALDWIRARRGSPTTLMGLEPLLEPSLEIPSKGAGTVAAPSS